MHRNSTLLDNLAPRHRCLRWKLDASLAYPVVLPRSLLVWARIRLS
jgi:hypothetical protein